MQAWVIAGKLTVKRSRYFQKRRAIKVERLFASVIAVVAVVTATTVVAIDKLLHSVVDVDVDANI